MKLCSVFSVEIEELDLFFVWEGGGRRRGFLFGKAIDFFRLIIKT